MFKKNIFGFLVYHFITTLILFSINSDILPQSKDKTIDWPELVFEHFTVVDGLPENSVRCILQDHLGYMWLDTKVGLVSYNMYNIKVFQLSPDDYLVS